VLILAEEIKLDPHEVAHLNIDIIVSTISFGGPLPVKNSHLV